LYIDLFTVEVETRDSTLLLLSISKIYSNTTQLMILLRYNFILFLSTTYFSSSYEPSSG